MPTGKVNAANMETCLFTGEVLTSNTREEHTIPRSLGGRIRSRIVSSDGFNERSGAYLDETLKSPYALMLNVLAPVMSAEHQSGLLEIDMPGEIPGLVLDGGAVTRRNLAVTERDPESGLPRAAVAADIRPLRNLAKQIGKSQDLDVSTVRAGAGTTFFRSGAVIFADLEIAALKCVLLTFDHVLRETEPRFTRLRQLANARELVRQAVMQRQVDGEICHQISLGQQYDRLPLYRELRQRIAVPETRFEHLLLAAGNASCRCIDLVWLVFGFDPFGFRVCTDWRGGDFAFGIVNGVLKSTGVSEVVALNLPDELLCRPTKLRSYPVLPFPPSEQQAAVQEVSRRRLEAFQEAVYFVESTADEWVVARFCEAAACDPPNERSMVTQICRKLTRLYGRAAGTDAFAHKLNSAIESHSAELPSTLRAQEISIGADAATADWARWLSVYRKCLAEMRDAFGLPGDAFQQRAVVRTDRTGERMVGEHPTVE